jgi:hypothetical protein
MARSKRRRNDQPRPRSDSESGSGGSGDLIGQIGLFETGNGLPHGPLAILVAVILALIAYPISRLIGLARRR